VREDLVGGVPVRHSSPRGLVRVEERGRILDVVDVSGAGTATLSDPSRDQVITTLDHETRDLGPLGEPVPPVEERLFVLGVYSV
jgi:hypothetical protein